MRSKQVLNARLPDDAQAADRLREIADELEDGETSGKGWTLRERGNRRGVKRASGACGAPSG